MSSFHLCKQKDSMQCGIACLSMICSYYNKEYSVDTLSQYCFATTEGVSLLGMSKAADKLGYLAFYIGIKIILLYFNSQV
nr:cysteine peptidase family C39 domain-containing protein [Phocaeicola massiliensis]